MESNRLKPKKFLLVNGRLQSGVYTTGPGVGLGRASEPHRRRPDQGLLQGQSLNGMNGLVVQKFPGISETPREQQELDKQKENKKKRKEKEELRIEQLETRSNQNFVKRILIEGDS